MLDRIKSVALEGYIRNKFGDYLQDGDFSADLNTDEKFLKLAATLAGEDFRTEFNIDKFEIRESGDAKFLVVRRVSGNRQWLVKLANDYLVGYPVELPSFIAAAL